MTKLRVQKKNEYDKLHSTETRCGECGDPVLIQYPSHPGLHSKCFRTWKEANPGKTYTVPPPTQFAFDEASVLAELRARRKDVPSRGKN